MTGKRPENSHHWLLCGCGIALAPFTPTQAFQEYIASQMLDRSAQIHTNETGTSTHSHHTRAPVTCLHVWEQRPALQSSNPCMCQVHQHRQGGYWLSTHTPLPAAMPKWDEAYEITNIMQFNVHYFLLPRTVHILFLLSLTSAYTLKMFSHTQSTGWSVCERGLSQEVQYKKVYIYRQAGRRQEAVSLSASICHI